jgi:hypothetical protein
VLLQLASGRRRIMPKHQPALIDAEAGVPFSKKKINLHYISKILVSSKPMVEVFPLLQPAVAQFWSVH